MTKDINMIKIANKPICNNGIAVAAVAAAAAIAAATAEIAISSKLLFRQKLKQKLNKLCPSPI